jgi:peptidyl-prolyl cis-trans isomerase C
MQLIFVFFIGSILAISSIPGTEQSIEMPTPQIVDSVPGPADPLTFPDVVARVNETPILKEDFLARAKFIQSEIGLPEGDLPIMIYRTILDEMVDMELLYQASQDRNFRAESDEIEERYQELVRRFPSEEAFLSQLKLPSVSPERFKELMYKDLSVQKLIAADFSPLVSVSDEAKLSYYRENKDKMEEPERLKLRHILTRVERGASESEKAKALKQIKDIHQTVLQEGVDFAAVAREFSDDLETKDSGGELVIQRGETVPVFEKTAFNLEPGSVSDVIETRFGFHVIKLCERIPARVTPYEEMEPVIEEVLQQKALKDLIDSEIKGLREKASLELFI